MTGTSRALARLGVTGLGAVVMFAGLAPLTELSAFAAQATTVTLSPGDTAAVGTCNEFTATVAPTGSDITVNIQQAVPAGAAAGAVVIGFCQPQTANPDAGPTGTAAGPGTPGSNTTAGGTAAPPATAANSCHNTEANPPTTPGFPNNVSCNAVYTDTNNDGKIVFGVSSNTPGNMTVNAFGDTNANGAQDAGESGQTSNKTWVANTASNTDTITCTPTSATNDTGDTHTFKCTVKNSSGTPLVNQKVGFRITSGPDAGVAYEPNGPSSSNSTDKPLVASNATCTTTNTGSVGSTPGEATCSFKNNGVPGQDSITVYEETNGINNQQNGEPSTVITKDFVVPPAPAPTTSNIDVTCSPNNTTAAADKCVDDPATDNTATFTATVTNGVPAQPVAGVRVTWSVTSVGANDPAPNTDTEDINPKTCITDAAGKCSTTFTDSQATDGEAFDVTGTIQLNGGGTDTDTARKTFHTPTASESRNISVEPEHQDAPSGSSVEFTATVTDRFGNKVGGVWVQWTESGPGAFRNGDECRTATTGDDLGTCTIEVSSLDNEAGDETITAEIEDFQFPADRTECAAPAGRTFTGTNNSTTTPPGDEAANAPAGNCTDTATVTWGAGEPPVSNERPHIDSPNVKDVQLGAHRHRIAGTAAPGHVIVLFKNGNRTAQQDTAGTGGHFGFKPFVKKRTVFYVRDITNHLASNSVTIYVKVFVTVTCNSPRDGKLVCHLDTDPTLKHAVVDWIITRVSNGKRQEVTGETNRRGNDKLVVTDLHSGTYQVKGKVHGKSKVRTGSGSADGITVG